MQTAVRHRRRISGKMAGGALGLLTDTFPGVDGTLIPPHLADTGQTWTAVRGAIDLLSNRAHAKTMDGTKADAIIVADSTLTDYDLWLTVNLGTNPSAAGIVSRYSAATDYWWMGFSTALSAVVLFEVTADVATQRATFSFSPLAGTDYPLRLSVRGNVFTGYLLASQAWVQCWTFTSAVGNTRTNVGLRSLKVGDIMDSFQVTR